MIRITDKAKCCGCAACAQACPKHCIAMVEDDEGFLYPLVDLAVCIDCGLCDKVCPCWQRLWRAPLGCYATVNADEQVRLQSSSGGLFAALAGRVLEQGGAVFAAEYDNCGEVFHSQADDLAGVRKMMGSKYVQSRMGSTYFSVKNVLGSGRAALFVGTPCQVAGLHSFLRGKEYPRLLTVDLACHGVPSPGVWRQYLSETLGNVKDDLYVNFRDKSTGWKHYSLTLKSGRKQISKPASESAFMKAFLSDAILRPSCQSCDFKNGGCQSDLTIGDFWGIGRCHPDWDDDKGMGITMVNTDKGGEAIACLSGVSFREVTYQQAIACNGGFVRDTPPHPKRKEFFAALRRNKTVAQAANAYLRKPLAFRVLGHIKTILRRILKH